MKKVSMFLLCLLVVVSFARSVAHTEEKQDDRQGCLHDSDCDDATFCNGPEECVSGDCQLGVPPCNAADPCILCVENEDRCGCDVNDNLDPCCCKTVCPECNFCEGDFDSDQDVDALDVAKFNLDYGRSWFNNPCTNANPCNGDFCCDGDVDSLDIPIMMADFGRGPFNNQCPMGSRVPWCSY